LFQDFQAPEKPFLRMNYSDAIKYLREHKICKDDGSFYEFGEVCYKSLDVFSYRMYNEQTRDKTL